ncbi:unnamed protein product [Caenorhabditis angaria]|uniref:Uncharacterized protein n=1 Tax=Caenorhabditis angaria TaxID=860376 RepID=A0A9P1N3V7_9PELO|nr:unnamed protein product [Caenorhabditis angaria]
MFLSAGFHLLILIAVITEIAREHIAVSELEDMVIIRKKGEKIYPVIFYPAIFPPFLVGLITLIFGLSRIYFLLFIILGVSMIEIGIAIYSLTEIADVREKMKPFFLLADLVRRGENEFCDLLKDLENILLVNSIVCYFQIAMAIATCVLVIVIAIMNTPGRGIGGDEKKMEEGEESEET